MKKKIICLIPVKKDSSRLKNKNFLKIGGKSLFEIAIKKAKDCKIFDEIFVSTDSPNAIKIANKFNLSAPFLRPKILSKDPATITDVMTHVENYYTQKKKKFDYMFVLHVTNPLITIKDIKASVNLFLNSKHDACMSVNKTTFPPYNSWIIKNNILLPAFKNSKYKFTKSTECPETFVSNGAFRIVKLKKFRIKNNFHSMKILPYHMDLNKSVDIDTKYEFQLAKLLLNEKK